MTSFPDRFETGREGIVDKNQVRRRIVLALNFRICCEAEVGEMWIDDVTLAPLVGQQTGP